MLVYKGTLSNLFKRPDFEKDGEFKKGKWQLEFMTQKEILKGEGHQLVLERISIPDTLYPKYIDKIGEEVEVNVGTIASGKSVILYGLE